VNAALAQWSPDLSRISAGRRSGSREKWVPVREVVIGTASVPIGHSMRVASCKAQSEDKYKSKKQMKNIRFELK
jgi:hypothetical protein